MAIYNGPPPTNTFKPIDWDKIAIPRDQMAGSIINANTFSGTLQYNLPGELLDYTMKYDMDWIHASGMPEAELNLHVKRELAAKLAQQMMDNGHIEFTKQTDLADNSVRFKAYTWVGNKAFIEQQRKNKR
jgi:hypothetical protein